MGQKRGAAADELLSTESGLQIHVQRTKFQFVSLRF